MQCCYGSYEKRREEKSMSRMQSLGEDEIVGSGRKQVHAVKDVLVYTWLRYTWVLPVVCDIAWNIAMC